MPLRTTFAIARYSLKLARGASKVEAAASSVDQPAAVTQTRDAIEQLTDDAHIAEKMAAMGFAEQAGTQKTYTKVVNGKEVELRLIDNASVRMTVRLPARSPSEPATIYSTQKIHFDEECMALESAIHAATEVSPRREAAVA